MTMSTPTIEPTHFRDVMGHLPTGVVVVAGREPGTNSPAGLIVGTFQSLSLSPPLVSFSVTTTSRSWPRIRPSGQFSASVLAAEQRHVCRALSTRGHDKFAEVDWHESTSGAPQIAGAHAWIDCRITQELPGGDHLIVIAEVCRLEAGHGEPLVFHRGRLGAIRERGH
ncbi:flavin reductase (DIM6/NTAB) family NADH-FMN oxidoreductase RutF [Tamaricihabitans halophyticus]|uniref:Flavin reductase (DIM6/NTAB) family NADH-FMN oxidoreductase RutF n=1 Tax=Tamaricihabitans halophyticus TaxID=1262583 RepID=A0A4R2QA37_9PSEU|nr:flavin reductase family protein [Tamaricihabitans halophyticus]TCP45787.1 flavin reductase (DIM6/NTAB) family NADH-FMN oxidoreductase RutF [Tamaricihabitans halophyticus]